MVTAHTIVFSNISWVRETRCLQKQVITWLKRKRVLAWTLKEKTGNHNQKMLSQMKKHLHAHKGKQLAVSVRARKQLWHALPHMHICVPVLILCPILGLIWVLSSYITSAKGDILVYTQCVGGYIQREHPWHGYIPGEKSRINPSMGQLMVEGGCPMVKWYPLCSIWWRTKSQGLL